MEKLKMHSLDKLNDNILKIGALFPNCLTERINANGELERAIDFDVLRQELSKEIVEGNEERYQFTWPDKKNAMRLANAPINKTLRPCREESVDFDTTQNLYIEGDNLEVLKLLQETYLGKIKMIYIDPPYNTGTNLIYKNDFSMDVEEFVLKDKQLSEDGNKLVLNSDSNGRFHTDWLNMMYSRLKVAKNVLADDGYITIAIDDNELYNLKKIVDEIFGEQNFIGTIVTRCNPQGRNKNNIDPVHEYHLVYSKNYTVMNLLRIKKRGDGQVYGYLMRSGTNSRKYERPYRFYPMLEKDGVVSTISLDEYNNIYNAKSGFDEAFLEALRDKYEALGYKYILPIARNGEEKVWQRVYDRVSKECSTYIYENGQIKMPAMDDRTPVSLWHEEFYSNVAYGTNNLKKLFDSEKIPFDFSKSIYTVKDLISLNSTENDIIIDFFPGSATTAHAVMQLNAEDGGKRKFIMIQLLEECDEKSEAFKAGYKNICEIGKERIRRAGKKIKEDNPLTTQDLDIGFRVLKCDSSNMKDVYYTPNDYNSDLFEALADNIKEDRTPEDLLFQVMLDLGVLLSSKIEGVEIGGKHIFNVENGYLMACFDNDLTEDVITEIAKKQPYYFVMRDSSMASDSVAANFEQIFNTYSPNTVRRVL